MPTHTLRYLSVYNDLKAGILSGKFAPDSFLPTEENLIKQYGVSRTTIRRATELLQKENLISVRQGRGSQILPLRRNTSPYSFYKFHNVTDVANRFLVDGDESNVAKGAIVDIIPAEVRVAKALEVEPGDQVYRLQRINFIGEHPFGYSVNYLRMDVAPGLDRFSNRIFNLYQFMEKEYNLYFDHGEESISATAAGFLESQLLGIEIGTPLLLFRRTAHCDAGILEYSEMFARSDLMEIVVKMQGAPAFYHN